MVGPPPSYLSPRISAPHPYRTWRTRGVASARIGELIQIVVKQAKPNWSKIAGLASDEGMAQQAQDQRLGRSRAVGCHPGVASPCHQNSFRSDPPASTTLGVPQAAFPKRPRLAEGVFIPSFPPQGFGVRRPAGDQTPVGLKGQGTSCPSGLGPGIRDDHLTSFFLCLFQAT